MSPKFKFLFPVAMIGLASLFLFKEDLPSEKEDEMDLLKKISRNLLVNYASKEEVAFETLWQDRACVITFLRRFG